MNSSGIFQQVKKHSWASYVTPLILVNAMRSCSKKFEADWKCENTFDYKCYSL